MRTDRVETTEQREKRLSRLRTAHARRMLDPEYRLKRKQQQMERYHKECAENGLRERMNERQRERRNDPDYRDHRISQRRSYRADPNYRAREIELERARYLSPEGRAKHLISGARLRAKKLNIDFNISVERVRSVIERGVCERTGMLFNMDAQGAGWVNNPFAPSLDRIIPGGPYTDENIQVVCCIYNIGKNARSDAQFIELCKCVLEHAGYTIHLPVG